MLISKEIGAFDLLRLVYPCCWFTSATVAIPSSVVYIMLCVDMN
jgi:hypothetical protein